VPIPATQGPDATDGNHPQGNVIEDNFFHEIGHFQKQVSCYFQGQTQLSTLTNNICFNGPRAGFNFNDGMGTVLSFLAINLCCSRMLLDPTIARRKASARVI
jgi:hypothetical protein